MHLEALKKQGWWDQIKNLGSAPIEVLKLHEQWSDAFYITAQIEEGDDIPDPRFLEGYKSLASWLVDYVVNMVSNSKTAAGEFQMQAGAIYEYLKRAIVPSTVVLDGQRIHPTPQVLIDAGYCFLLEHMATLLENVEGRDSESVRDLSQLAQRLELWMLKALEDNRLLTRQVNNVRNPSRRDQASTWA